MISVPNLKPASLNASNIFDDVPSSLVVITSLLKSTLDCPNNLRNFCVASASLQSIGKIFAPVFALEIYLLLSNDARES